MYWKHIIKEVKNKNNPQFPCYFTHIRNSQQQADKHSHTTQQKPLNIRYQLFNNKPHPYLTHQEARCIIHLISGKTIKETGHALALSHRTVEFYLNIVKKKCGCKNKKQLLEFITQSDFYKHICGDKNKSRK